MGEEGEGDTVKLYEIFVIVNQINREAARFSLEETARRFINNEGTRGALLQSSPSILAKYTPTRNILRKYYTSLTAN